MPLCDLFGIVGMLECVVDLVVVDNFLFERDVINLLIVVGL